MRQFKLHILLFFMGSFLSAQPQEVLNKTLLKADLLYIEKDYKEALVYYIRYLEKYPKDYYASRQTAICYNRLNDPGNAIDYWPIVAESSEVTEKDYLEYGKSLLANDRGPEAVKIFKFLSRSNDKSVSAWGKAYLNPMMTVVDTVNWLVKEVGGTNTEQSEASPTLFKEKLFITLDPAKGGRDYSAKTNLALQALRVYVKKDSIDFIPSLLYEKLQALNLYGQFCFSPDGEWFYFSRAMSNDELQIKSEVPFYKYQLFILKVSTLLNSAPDIVAFKHNLPDFDFIHPAISQDGKHLYFASNMKGSMGGKDLYVCEWENFEWATPVNLGPEVNTTGNEVFPHLSGENVLYFASDQRPGLGGLDIFYAEKNAEGKGLFSPARNAGAPINSRFDDFGVFVLKNGKAGYLSSNRKNNTDDDLYYFCNRK